MFAGVSTYLPTQVVVLSAQHWLAQQSQPNKFPQFKQQSVLAIWYLGTYRLSDLETGNLKDKVLTFPVRPGLATCVSTSSSCRQVLCSQQPCAAKAHSLVIRFQGFKIGKRFSYRQVKHLAHGQLNAGGL